MVNDNNKDKYQIINKDEVDLSVLLKIIWQGRKTIYYSVATILFIGIMIAFLSPVMYSASATLLPSAERRSNGIGGLSALAGMAGVNLGSMMGESNGIPAEIYPQVVRSYPFLNELINKKFSFEQFDEPISIYDYLLSDTIESTSDLILKYTLRLPWTIKDAISSKEEGVKNNRNIGVLLISKKEKELYEKVRGLIDIEVDKNTGLVLLSVEYEDPVVTAQLVQKGGELLQDYIIEYKTKQARESLSFVESGYEEKKEQYELLQKEIFNYRDRHRNLVSERINIEFQRLSDEYDLVSSIYNELAMQLEKAKIAVKEQTPAFSILEPAKVPVERSGPKRKIILVVSIFLGFFLGVTLIFVKIFVMNVRRGLRQE
ncbi:GNVR domain-containing protein [Carboxylicivirga linearis]|uniref:Lipopolysaccharide biosynthesis protein n=1 Tax=Carboxylicivirga linearis TaxID=1628157 RepID=A0ABS5K0T1_9BACT|nr:GNVR domain-containing protein [Carboxylicivirga linearis]MBS2100773.1 lipopolysaccharide biosynthesis protein [Carboxylicivirga linearis]